MCEVLGMMERGSTVHDDGSGEKRECCGWSWWRGTVLVVVVVLVRS